MVYLIEGVMKEINGFVVIAECNDCVALHLPLIVYLKYIGREVEEHMESTEECFRTMKIRRKRRL